MILFKRKKNEIFIWIIAENEYHFMNIISDLMIKK